MLRRYPKGWWPIVRKLENDINRVSEQASINEIGESQYGELQCYYSPRNLTPQQQYLIDNIVERAEKVALETCVECGEYGRLAYTATPPRARVFCEEHKPLDWNILL